MTYHYVHRPSWPGLSSLYHHYYLYADLVELRILNNKQNYTSVKVKFSIWEFNHGYSCQFHIDLLQRQYSESQSANCINVLGVSVLFWLYQSPPFFWYLCGSGDGVCGSIVKRSETARFCTHLFNWCYFLYKNYDVTQERLLVIARYTSGHENN